MEKKQQTSSVSGWIKEKINAAKAYQKTAETSGQSQKTKKQNDTHMDGSLSILRSQAHTLRSLQ